MEGVQNKKFGSSNVVVGRQTGVHMRLMDSRERGRCGLRMRVTFNRIRASQEGQRDEGMWIECRSYDDIDPRSSSFLIPSYRAQGK